MPAIRVLLSDDDRCIRKCLGTLLCSEEGIEVVGEAADGVEATAKAQELEPDVVLMDVEMPRMGGIEATRSIKRRHPSTRVVVFSVYDAAMHDALQAGADCFLLKDCGRARLAEAIRSAGQAGVPQRSFPVDQRGATTDVRGVQPGHAR